MARHGTPRRSLNRVRSGRTTFGEFAAVISGAALVTALFFDWYGRSVGPVEASISGWESLTAIDVVLVLVAALAIAQWVARGSGWLDRPLPLAPAAVVAGAGTVALVLVVLRIADLPEAAVAADLDGRRVGTFLALFGALGIVLGAVAALGSRGETWRPRREAGLVHDPGARPDPPVVDDSGRGPGQP